jgi:ubiquitin carboxyl-terminal hydrolase L3
LHAIGNARSILTFESNSYLERFFALTESMTPDEIAVYLNEDPEIEETHESAATEGQTEAVMDVETHFVCFRFV